MTNVAVPAEVAVTTYRAEDLGDARTALGGAEFASDAVWDALTSAAGRPDFLLVVGSGEKGPVGCAAASLTAGAGLLDPVVTAPGLPRLVADRSVTDLVGALLDAQKLPWGGVAVRSGSPGRGGLPRSGLRAVETAPDAP